MVKIAARISRWDYCDLQKTRHRTPTKAARRVMWDRMAKRYLKSKGYLGPKIPSIWDWTCNDQSGRVTGHTRSDARAEIKKTLGKKLPSNLVITKASHVE
jgi:hypothetical protein